MLVSIRVSLLRILRDISLVLFALDLPVDSSPVRSTEELAYVDTTAIIWYMYVNPVRALPGPATVLAGWYDVRNTPAPESGTLVHTRSADGQTHGCSAIVNAPFGTKWIALVKRGECLFQQKIVNAIMANASAVIVYNNVYGTDAIRMHHIVDGIVTVFIHRKEGELLANLTDSGEQVHVNISMATQYDRADLTGLGFRLSLGRSRPQGLGFGPVPGKEPHLARFVVFIVPVLIVLLPVAVFLIYTYGWRDNECRLAAFFRYQRQEDEPSTDPAL